MSKVKNGEETVSAVVSLAFRVKDRGDNLYSAEMLLLHDNKVVSARNGVATTLGHAIGMADDLMDGWAFSQVETKPEKFFEEVYL
jgi:hypothetical protein